MIRTVARNTTFIHGLFLVASLIAVTLDQILYRIALVVILVAIRVWWIQAFTSRKEHAAAAYGARHGVTFYRELTLPHPESIDQTDLDQNEVGR